jgi:GNAT superfamily N-acetyltransferase
MLKTSYIIKRLNNSHREKVLFHFKRLDAESLRSRFCSFMNESAIELYVSKINFNKNGIFGIFDDNLNIVGVGECVVEDTNKAEVAFCVELQYQNQGLGGKLLERIVRFAKAREKTHLEMLCLKSNQKSQYLAKKFGLKIKYSTNGETLAIIDMDKNTSIIEQFNENVDENLAAYWISQRENMNSWVNMQNQYSSFSQKCFFELMKSFIEQSVSSINNRVL